jgi:Na+-translocating ferredoxin:NAD+ oxidoreductase RnfE subunit
MRGIVPRAELALILIMGLGFLLIVQQWSFAGYQLGLLTVIVATILNIAVGNLPRAAGLGRALRLTFVLLAIVAVVFVAGIVLVPYLARLGG